MRSKPKLFGFNRGVISKFALARDDISQVAMGAETQTNWVPRSFGSMMLRPGMEYIDTFTNMESDDNIFLIPFVYDNDDTAIIEVFYSTGGGVIRVRDDDTLITFPSVSTTISNADPFVSGLTSWTDDDDVGATSQYGTDTGMNPFMNLTSSNGFAYARRYQQVTVSGGDQNTEHAIKITVAIGPVLFSVGSSQGSESYVTRTIIDKGEHVFSFTPTGNFYIDVASDSVYEAKISAIEVISGSSLFFDRSNAIEASIPYIKYSQSSDVVYFTLGNENDVGTSGGSFWVDERWRTYKIKRYSTRSWGLEDYIPKNGPFLPYNKTGITLRPGAVSGSTTLVASSNFFRSSHEGALFAIDSIGQKETIDVTGADQWSDPIRVFGTNRSFFVTLAGTWTATVTVQRSIGVTGSWVDLTTTYSSNGTNVVNDERDNEIIYYRVGVATGDFTSGTVELELEYSEGSSQGICLVTERVSGTNANIIVLTNFSGVDATTHWREGRWSRERGFPDAVSIHDGRLWWAGKQYVDGSESDQYESFDDTIEGDSKPVSRTIGYGPMDHINWLVSLNRRLFLGTAASEIQAKSSIV